MTTLTPDALGKLLAEATPRPWYPYEDEDGNTVAVSFQSSKFSRASICQMPAANLLSRDAINANAAMIIAAPALATALLSSQARERELVKALRTVQRWLSDEPIWNSILTLPNETFGARIDALLTRIEADRKGEQ